MLPFNMGAGGASGVDTGDIPASLRFRSAGSTRMSRTPAASNQKTFTISFWVRRGTLGVEQRILQTRDNNGSSANAFGVYFTATNTLYVYRYSSALQLAFESSALFRDPTAWYHIVVSIDTTQATASDRAKIYVNGVLQNTPSTLPAQNLDMYWNSAVQHNIGCFDAAGAYSWFLDGYIARICSIDGTALTPSSFGYQNTEINEWVSKSQSAVKAVVDAGGTNSFMLDFDNGTSLTTLGYDKSSKGNDWTLNNFSLTAGTSYDWMLDVPGNSYPTWNPLAVRTGAPLSTFSAGNLNVVNTSTLAAAYTNSTMPLLPGETWFEATVIGSARSDSMVGIADVLVMNTVFTNTYTYLQNGNIYANGAVVTTGATYTVGDVIGVKANRTTNKMQFYKQTGGAGAFVAQGTELTINANIEYFAHTSNTNSSGYAINFGQRPLNQTGVSQSTLLCQRNMPDPAILNPEKHFDVVTWTGTAATKSITGLGFEPGLVEMKSRGRALDWAYYDIARGVEKRLESNNTDAEVTGDTTGLTSFNSDGWTMGALDQINGTTATNSFVGFAWKAGGAAVTNNAGSISSQVSANVEAGFSIVTFTSQPSGSATVGHGLGKVPGLIITKHRNLSTGWQVYHAFANATPQNGGLILNSTAAYAANSNLWNNTAPTTSVFTSGAYFTASEPIVAYCFADIEGYSKAFSYTGNGSADGPYVHLGFKPKYVLIKRVDAAATWCVIDGVRNPSNVENLRLYPSAATAEETNTYLDATSNGFKVRVDSAEPTMNASGGTYIGIAFADVPAKYSLAR